MRWLAVVMLVAGCTHEPRQREVAAPAVTKAPAPEVTVVEAPPDQGPAEDCFGPALGSADCGFGPYQRGPFLPVTVLRDDFPRDPRARSALLSVGVSGDRLVLSIDACQGCAALMRLQRVVDLTTASEAQLTRAQRWLGLPARPLLRSGAAWLLAFDRP